MWRTRETLSRAGTHTTVAIRRHPSPAQYQGHTSKVQAIRLIPKTAHLLLSAGMDAKLKIWDVNGTRKCMRTYLVRMPLPPHGQPCLLGSSRVPGPRFGVLRTQRWASDPTPAPPCTRTQGHSKAVRDIEFSSDGRRFLSCGFDRYVKLWDTETGACIGSYTTRKIPYCVKFNPMDEHQNEFLVGQADKKIIQWSISDDKIVQEYDQHLARTSTSTSP